MKVVLNMNESVKVKITDFGIKVLKQRHDELNEKIKARGGKGTKFELKLDEDGYYTTQLWHLMNIFGEYAGLAAEPPFDINIVIERTE